MYSPSDNAVRIPVSAYSYLQTVSQNRSHFTCREVQGADAARKLYKQVGRPSHARFLSYLQQGLIRNSPVTLDNAHCAWHIYGPDIAYLKGKTTQRSPLPHIEMPTTLPLPDFITSQPSHGCHLMHRLLLCAEAAHIISRKIGYRTTIPVENRSKTTIIRALRKEIKLYVGRSLMVRDVHADNEFECAHDALERLHTEDGFRDLQHAIRLEICTMNEHVREAERSIRTMKEVIRSCYSAWDTVQETPKTDDKGPGDLQQQHTQPHSHTNTAYPKRSVQPPSCEVYPLPTTRITGSNSGPMFW